MMVPRTFRYSASPKPAPPQEKSRHKSTREAHARSVVPKTAAVAVSYMPTTEYASAPLRSATKPVAVPNPHARRHQRTAPSASVQEHRTSKAHRKRSTSDAHDPTALPPAVAALLAVTAIPPRSVNSRRRKAGIARHMSIDELVHEWKKEDSYKDSYGSSLALSILLEDVDDSDEQAGTPMGSLGSESFLCIRSASSESVPSLEADGQSFRSVRSPSTPGSLRSRPSLQTLRKERCRSSPVPEICPLDHPLARSSLAAELDESEVFVFSTPNNRSASVKPASSFRSNLTSSLQAIKNAAFSSFSFGKAASSAGAGKAVAPFADDMLWSHPYLFPHFSTEVRPQTIGLPTEAQRRYLNPTPLVFEEQEAPFQRALHGPYLAERDEYNAAPTIQMQTYTRAQSRRKSRGSTNSEAGRALMGATGVRQREPRENSDFLRVVVLEMNMRRQGKIEAGRAKIWLPPRQAVNLPSAEASSCCQDRERVATTSSRVVPARWMGISAY